jgi:hypothetical protein
MIAFVANVRVGTIEAHLAFDSDPGKTDRELVEVFLPDERGGIAEGRIIRRHLLEVACPASMSMPADGPRVSRALRQYELALREWYVGGEWLALSHLWIQVGTEQPGFHTKRQPDSFTDMIASACVMAQLDLLKRGAILFDWGLNDTRIDELIAKATAIKQRRCPGGDATHMRWPNGIKDRHRSSTSMRRRLRLWFQMAQCGQMPGKTGMPNASYGSPCRPVPAGDGSLLGSPNWGSGAVGAVLAPRRQYWSWTGIRAVRWRR